MKNGEWILVVAVVMVVAGIVLAGLPQYRPTAQEIKQAIREELQLL